LIELLVFFADIQ